jgi:GNAT superfamily N-acetyltransferase
MRVKVVTYNMEMTERGLLRASKTLPYGAEVRRAELPCPSINRFFYEKIGADWHWTDRLAWTDEQWLQYLSRDALETWIAYQRGTPAGYFELERQEPDSVEIAYLGLLPEFVGCGLGGWFLTQAIEKAWAMKPLRVWVHTCTLDHPSALANYQARGFRLFREDESTVDLADAETDQP